MVKKNHRFMIWNTEAEILNSAMYFTSRNSETVCILDNILYAK